MSSHPDKLDRLISLVGQYRERSYTGLSAAPFSSEAWELIDKALRAFAPSHVATTNERPELSKRVQEAINKGPVVTSKPGTTEYWETPSDFAKRIAEMVLDDCDTIDLSCFAPSSTRLTEAPLAWIVFCDKHPEGFDYVVFGDESDADSYAVGNEIADDQIVPLYRAGAFGVSATRLTNDPFEGDLPTEHPNRCKLRDDLLYKDGGPAWRCHKREGHDGPCSTHNDCGVKSSGRVVCGLQPGHSGPHAWATEFRVATDGRANAKTYWLIERNSKHKNMPPSESVMWFREKKRFAQGDEDIWTPHAHKARHFATKEEADEYVRNSLTDAELYDPAPDVTEHMDCAGPL